MSFKPPERDCNCRYVTVKKRVFLPMKDGNGKCYGQAEYVICKCGGEAAKYFHPSAATPIQTERTNE